MNFHSVELAKQDRRRRLAAVAPVMVALIFALGGPRQLHAQNAKTPYPSMAPLEQYLMSDRNAEIALARSAAPEAISRDATVLVLGRHGYETAVAGKNGFVCVVERAWMAPFDNAEFWNPRIRGPLCFNPPAARSILPIDYKRTEKVLAGLSREQLREWTQAAYAKKELPAVEPGAMCYMLSREAYLTDDGSHNLAHLMLYTPRMDGASWGADVPNSPVMVGDQGPPQPFTMFLVRVGKWSDGTSAQSPR